MSNMSIIVRPTSIKCVWSLDTCFEKLSVSKAYVSQDHLPKSPKKEISEKKKKTKKSSLQEPGVI